ncbi:MAG TPA: Gfo/Idh/MocA family oxidoreductase, partial [Chlamydiales bacterium]|nr:Gfo/Idh/MocA family oxidoreductase [Chlamydiales bacterium]
DLRAVTVRHYARSPGGVSSLRNLPWRVDPAFSYGGLFFETACHTIDALDFLFGPITVTGSSAINSARDYHVVDTVTASFLFANGIPGSGVWCFATDREFETIEVIGSKGTISFHLYSFAPISITRDGRIEEIDVANPPHVQQPLIQSIVNELNGIGSCPSTGKSAARTALITEEILELEHAKIAAPISTRNGQ